MPAGSCPPQPAPEQFRSIRRAITATFPIVVALVLLPPIAFASPPDLSWIAGIYDDADDADGDDIVSLLYETSAANVAAPSHLGPLPCLLETSLEGIPGNIAGRHFNRGPRSLPVLGSSEFTHVFTSSVSDGRCRSSASRISVKQPSPARVATSKESAQRLLAAVRKPTLERGGPVPESGLARPASQPGRAPEW
jgi:hypothetical protein